MSQNNVQSTVVIVQVPGLVVAMGPFTLHQERPRHVFSAAQVWNLPLHSSPRCSNFISRQIGTLLVDKRDGVGIFGRLLRMCREAVSFTRCRGAGGQKQVHRPPRRTPVDMGLERTYCMSLAVDTMGAEPLKRKFTVVARVYYVGLITYYLNW